MSPFWYKVVGWWYRVRPQEMIVGANMMMEGYTDWEIDVEEAGIRRMHMKDIKELLLSAPDSQLDHSLFPLIRQWSEPPKAVQILEVLDQCIFCSLASGFTVHLLQTLYELACKDEGTTHEEVVKLAVWRNQP